MSRGRSHQQAELPLGYELQAIIITVLGVPVFAALAVGSIIAPLITDRRWGGPAILLTFSLIGLAVAFRAFFRVRRGSNEKRAWLAWMVPLLVVIGGLAGSAVSFAVGETYQENHRAVLESACAHAFADPKELLPPPFDERDPNYAACMILAERCDKLVADVDFSNRSEARVGCLRDELKKAMAPSTQAQPAAGPSATKP